MRVEAELDRAPVALETEPRRRSGVVEDAGAKPVAAWVVGVLAALVVGGGVLRVWGLGAHRLNYDESFTAMAGRLPLGGMFAYLRAHDSHPPLDYLLRAPLARMGVSDLLLRLPSALCSVGALALFAWWMRRRSVAGVVAVALMSVSAFQIVHGREARMYAEMELVGVACAVLADSWLRHARRWHAPAIGALVLVGLLTHVSMVLLAVGLLALPALRRDREAWRWRLAVVAAGVAWAVLWGPTFWVQARGGHSSWIPPTTLRGLNSSFGRLVTFQAQFFTVVLLAMLAGAVVMWRRDRRLATLWTCCFLVPAVAGAVAGLVAPVVLDRTFTVIAWGPLLALGFLIGELFELWAPVGLVAIGALAFVALASTFPAVQAVHGPDAAMQQLRRVARPGDVIAANPGWRGVQTRWSIAVHAGLPARDVALRELPRADAFVLGNGPESGRIWLLDWRRADTAGLARCATTWSRGSNRILCLAVSKPPARRGPVG